jgi:hypothetical protein
MMILSAGHVGTRALSKLVENSGQLGWSTAQPDPFCLQRDETIGTTTLA